MSPDETQPARSVMAVAGGSGGHRYPAEAFLAALKKIRPGWRLGLAVDRRAMEFAPAVPPLHPSEKPRKAVCSKSPRCEAPRSDAYNKRTRATSNEADGAFSADCYPLSSWNPGGWRGFLSPSKGADLVRAFRDSMRLLSRHKPDLILGFGSYASVPPLLLAAAKGIPTVIHEQNSDWGLANGFLRHWVDRAAVAIPSEKLLSFKKAAVTGMPLRPFLAKVPAEEARRALGLEPSKRTLLVTGGSQGSLVINRVFEEFLQTLAGRIPDWQFLHLYGKRASDSTLLSSAGVIRIEFLKEMHLAYSAADAVLSRAGASSLHEIAYYRKPSLLIPYPFARAHQAGNARFVEARGGAAVILERDFRPDILRNWLQEFERNPEKMRKMGESAAAALNSDGAGRLADLVVRRLENHRWDEFKA